jgi:hypothetical protein
MVYGDFRKCAQSHMRRLMLNVELKEQINAARRREAASVVDTIS